MKVNIYRVEFTCQMFVDIAAPDGVTKEMMHRIALNAVNDNGTEWEPEAWEAVVHEGMMSVDVCDEERETCRVGGTIRSRKNIVYNSDAAVTDDQQSAAAPLLCKWWQVEVPRFAGPEAVGKPGVVHARYGGSDYRAVSGFLFDEVPGLAVNQIPQDSEWRVTHIGSGYALRRCADKAEAFRAVARFGESGIDWTMDSDRLMNDPEVKSLVWGGLPDWAKASDP